MKIAIFSDLHLEFGDLHKKLTIDDDVNVVIFSGDVTNKGPDKSIEILANWDSLKNKQVLFVAGNHEFYKSSLVEGIQEGIEAAKKYPNIHFLHNESIVLDGVKFVGCTLWTDFKLAGHQQLSLVNACNVMNDYKSIKYSKKPYQRLNANQILLENMVSQVFLKETLADNFDGKTVVITHHAPLKESISEKYRHKNDGNEYYVSELNELILDYTPDVWVHGHVHNSNDYIYDQTRIISNPKGYPVLDKNQNYLGDENRDFDYHFSIEI